MAEENKNEQEPEQKAIEKQPEVKTMLEEKIDKKADKEKKEPTEIEIVKEEEKEGTNKGLEKKYNDFLEKIEKMSVVELSELVKAIENRFGISAAAITAGGGESGKSGEEEKTNFNVVLKSAGSSKIQVIKAIKEITGLGLQEAKALVDSAPKAVKEGVKKEEAEELKKKLEEAGATAELQ